MEQTNNLYVVKMNRWGDPELHSYVIGVYDNLELAKAAGIKEETYRGGKYSYDVIMFELNAMPSSSTKIIDKFDNM